MRARTPFGAAAVLVVTAAVALAGCGGGGGGSNDKISSAPTTSSAPATSATAAPPSGGAPLKLDPALKLPADITLTFDWQTPADRTKAAVLTATANYMQAMTHAVVKQSTSGSSLGNYATGQAFTFAEDYVQRHINAKLTVTGTDRYYRPVVKVTAGKPTAVVTLCENQGKLYSKEIATGKTDVTPEDADSFVSYDIALTEFRPGSGLWRASAITVKGRAAQCQQ